MLPSGLLETTSVTPDVPAPETPEKQEVVETEEPRPERGGMS